MKRLANKKAGVIGAAVVASATAIIMQWEGLRLKPYKDPIGIPTVCYGQTGDFAKSPKTLEQCKERLNKEVVALIERVRQCSAPNPPNSVLAAFTSASYNIGERIACGKTTASKYLRAGNWEAACKELPKWTYAGGKQLQGLVNRRSAEYRLCMQDLEQKKPPND